METNSLFMRSQESALIRLLHSLTALIWTESLPALAFQTSSESSQTFSQYMSPVGGVDRYSGNPALCHPLYTLPGRGGMNVCLALRYSRNVMLSARARNDVGPTGWVGLGWAMGFGSIHCVHNGTKTHADDRFYLVSPTGVSGEIIEKDGTFYLKNNPNIELEPHSDASGVYRGWTVTGTKHLRTDALTC